MRLDRANNRMRSRRARLLMTLRRDMATDAAPEAADPVVGSPEAHMPSDRLAAILAKVDSAAPEARDAFFASIRAVGALAELQGELEAQRTAIDEAEGAMRDARADRTRLRQAVGRALEGSQVAPLRGAGEAVVAARQRRAAPTLVEADDVLVA